jgi:purine-binding chemotaxis protein CheW
MGILLPSMTMTRDAPPSGSSSHAALVAELRRLEEALQRTHGELLALGGESVAGLHLVVEAAGRRALLSSARVVEIVRLVATEPLAGAPRYVLGTFVCRGGPVVVYDLAAHLGVEREPALDAQIVVLAGMPAMGLVVDRIERLVDGPRAFGGGAEALPDAWKGSPLVVGLCVEGGQVLPVIDPAPLSEKSTESSWS